MDKRTKKQLDNYDDTITYLKNHINYLKKQHEMLLETDPKIQEKRHIIIYAKLISFSVVLHKLTKNIKEL